MIRRVWFAALGMVVTAGIVLSVSQGAYAADLTANILKCGRAGTVAPDDRIEACSAVIESRSPKASPLQIALAHFTRGRVYLMANDNDRALLDRMGRE